MFKRLIARAQWEWKWLVWLWHTPSHYSLMRMGLDKESRDVIFKREVEKMPSLAEWMKDKAP